MVQYGTNTFLGSLGSGSASSNFAFDIDPLIIDIFISSGPLTSTSHSFLLSSFSTSFISSGEIVDTSSCWYANFFSKSSNWHFCSLWPQIWYLRVRWISSQISPLYGGVHYLPWWGFLCPYSFFRGQIATFSEFTEQRDVTPPAGAFLSRVGFGQG